MEAEDDRLLLMMMEREERERIQESNQRAGEVTIVSRRPIGEREDLDGAGDGGIAR